MCVTQRPADRATGTWSEKLGNHRAVLRVDDETEAVFVRVPWRRRDRHPDRKAIWLYDAKTGRRIRNVWRGVIDRELGELVFQPNSGPGEYYVYYMPFRNKGSSHFPIIRYIGARNTADPSWVERHRLAEPGVTDLLPKAEVVAFEAISDFHRFDPMEIPASEAEMQTLVAKYGNAPFLVFPEDRSHPIRMNDELPLRWIRSGPRRTFHGKSLRGEFYVFQLGIYALGRSLEDLHIDFGTLRNRSGCSIGSTMRCFNLGGRNWLGEKFRKPMDLEKGKIQALWFGLQVPRRTSPGDYQGELTLHFENAPPAKVKIAIEVLERTLKDRGDGDLWRHSRLRWLDSNIGLDDEALPPCTPIRLEEQTLRVLGRSLRFGRIGLPESITSSFSSSVDDCSGGKREILAGPIRFLVEGENEVAEWKSEGVKVTKVSSGAVSWEAKSKAGGMELACHAKMECDGYVNYSLELTTKNSQIKNIQLVIPLRNDVARYMIGMGRKGGYRPKRWSWTWNIDRSNCHLWIGDVNAGLHVKLKHLIPDLSLFNLRDTGIYRDWGTGGKGGCTITEEPEAVVIRAFTGPIGLRDGKRLHFNFGLMITPVKPLDKEHWGWRYFHASSHAPVSQISKTGATIVNIHHGNKLNPYINYPFRTTDELQTFIRQANANSIKVKIYYTVRELSNHCVEFWALRSLGDEVFAVDPEFAVPDTFGVERPGPTLRPTGDSWLCEHPTDRYIPAWHQRLGNGHWDAAVAQRGLSRWHNYYLEGLDWLVRKVGIQGLYLDGVGFDREIMKRLRKVMKRANPASLIDLHSGNSFDPRYGMNNPASLYAELFPYIDSIWFGEGFDYDETPDYWLVEVSGIPFGVFGEMLQGGGNPWRGMIYGMTNRLGWGGDPGPIWKIWDEFGIEDAKMVGYWDPSCPVRTGNSDVLATAYIKMDRVLVALASWADKPVKCGLRVDWKALGLDPAKAKVYAPAIVGYQPRATYEPSDPIPVEPGRGWLLILEERRAS